MELRILLTLGIFFSLTTARVVYKQKREVDDDDSDEDNKPDPVIVPQGMHRDVARELYNLEQQAMFEQQQRQEAVQEELRALEEQFAKENPNTVAQITQIQSGSQQKEQPAIGQAKQQIQTQQQRYPKQKQTSSVRGPTIGQGQPLAQGVSQTSGKDQIQDAKPETQQTQDQREPKEQESDDESQRQTTNQSGEREETQPVQNDQLTRRGEQREQEVPEPQDQQPRRSGQDEQQPNVEQEEQLKQVQIQPERTVQQKNNQQVIAKIQPTRPDVLSK